MDENMQWINFNLAEAINASFARLEKAPKIAEAINASFARYEKAINSKRKKTRLEIIKDFISVLLG